MFYETHGEEPKQEGKRPNEKQLYTWMSHRREDKKKGTLDPTIEAALLAACPWFSFDPFADAHTTAIRELKMFYETHEEGPGKRGKRPNEKQLAIWMCNRRRDKKKGTLTPDIERQIREALPWFTF